MQLLAPRDAGRRPIIRQAASFQLDREGVLPAVMAVVKSVIWRAAAALSYGWPRASAVEWLIGSGTSWLTR